MEESKVAAALANTDYHFFLRSASTNTSSAFFPAYISFIYFHRTIQQRAIYLRHCSANPVAEIPCRLVRAFVVAPDRALELECAHTFFGFAKQECSEKPLLQGQMGIVEYRARCDGELIVAILAIKQLLRSGKVNGWHVASWTFDASRPA